MAQAHEVILYLQTRKLCWSHVWLCGRDSSPRQTHVWPHPLLLLYSNFLYFTICLSPLLKCSFPPFIVSHVAIALALFWSSAPMIRYRGDVMQVCAHECLSTNFTLYFSQCERPSQDWLSIFIKLVCVVFVCGCVCFHGSAWCLFLCFRSSEEVQRFKSCRYEKLL